MLISYQKKKINSIFIFTLKHYVLFNIFWLYVIIDLEDFTTIPSSDFF